MGHGNDRLDYPVDFDAALYRSHYPDLQNLSYAGLVAHYEKHGRHEGRQASKISDRASFLSYLPHDASILEIGPFADPVSSGPTVRYFDVLSTEDLQHRATSIGRDPASVPHIDYVSPDGNLRAIDAVFDAVISSHCIEHQPDLVSHLVDVGKLLTTGGCYALIIPDCRYCFDHFLPPSSIAEVLDGHYAKRRVHSLASVIEHRAMTGHNDPTRYWRHESGELTVDAGAVQAAIDEWKQSDGRYLDVHAWQFTPASFRQITRLLFELGVSPLAPFRIYDTPHGSLEFYAVLKSDRGLLLS